MCRCQAWPLCAFNAKKREARVPKTEQPWCVSCKRRTTGFTRQNPFARKGPKEWDGGECWRMHEAALNIGAIKLPPSLSKPYKKKTLPAKLAVMLTQHTIPPSRSGIIPVRGTRPWEEEGKKMSSLILDSSVIEGMAARNALMQGSLDNALKHCYFSLKKFPSWSGGQTPACWPTLGHNAWGADSHKITTAGPLQPRPTPAAEVVLQWVSSTPECIILLSGSRCNDLFYWGLCVRHTNVLHGRVAYIHQQSSERFLITWPWMAIVVCYVS